MSTSIDSNDWFLPELPQFREVGKDPVSLRILQQLIRSGALCPEHPIGKYTIGIRRADEFPEVAALFQKAGVKAKPRASEQTCPKGLVTSLHKRVGLDTELSPTMRLITGDPVRPAGTASGDRQPKRPPSLSEIRARSKQMAPPKATASSTEEASREDDLTETGTLDPVAESSKAPEEMRVHEWYLPDLPEFGKRASHPQTLWQLRKLIQEGVLAPDHKLRRGDGPAIEASRYPEIIPLFQEVYPEFHVQEEEIYRGETRPESAEELYTWDDVVDDAPTRSENVGREHGDMDIPNVRIRSEEEMKELGLLDDAHEEAEIKQKRHEVNAFYAASFIGLISGFVLYIPMAVVLLLQLPQYVDRSIEGYMLDMARDQGLLLLGCLAVGSVASLLSLLYHYKLMLDDWDYLPAIGFGVLSALGFSYGYVLLRHGVDPQKLSLFRDDFVFFYVVIAGMALGFVMFLVNHWFNQREHRGYVSFSTHHRSGQLVWTVLAGLMPLAAVGAAVGDAQYRQRIAQVVSAGIQEIPGLSVSFVDHAPYDAANRSFTVRGVVRNALDEKIEFWYFDIILKDESGRVVDRGRVINENFIQFRGTSPGRDQVRMTMHGGSGETILYPREQWRFEETFTALEREPVEVEIEMRAAKLAELKDLFDRY